MIPFTLEQNIHQVITKKLSLKDFENWLYQEDDLESVNPDLYFELISFDYSNEDNFKAFYDNFAKYVDMYKFEAERINEMLHSIINRDENCADVTCELYYLYCQGYEFLYQLGIYYGLDLVLVDHNTSDLTDKVLDKFYPKIVYYAKKVSNWLKEDKIVFKNEHNDYGLYKYDDFRSEEEQLKQ